MCQGSTDAHVDISGAVNLMMNVVAPKIDETIYTAKQRTLALRTLLDEGGVEEEVIDKLIESKLVPG